MVQHLLGAKQSSELAVCLTTNHFPVIINKERLKQKKTDKLIKRDQYCLRERVKMKCPYLVEVVANVLFHYCKVRDIDLNKFEVTIS